jgi:hypothetical protein
MTDRNGTGTHLLFIWKSSGYELREADGEVPELGSKVAVDDGEEQVIKIAASPLPNDSRLCAYLQAL